MKSSTGVFIGIRAFLGGYCTENWDNKCFSVPLLFQTMHFSMQKARIIRKVNWKICSLFLSYSRFRVLENKRRVSFKVEVSSIVRGLQPQFYVKTGQFHCVKSGHIRSFFGRYFPAFGLNTERYSVFLRIQSKWRKIRTRETPNKDFFQAVFSKLF